jgi:hypothetical protein
MPDQAAALMKPCAGAIKGMDRPELLKRFGLLGPASFSSCVGPSVR